jgi:hypothetical protein
LLLFQCLALFFKYGTGKSIQELVLKFSGIESPAIVNCDQVFTMKCWGSDRAAEKMGKRPPPDFDDLADILAGVDFPKLEWKTPEDLAEQALRLAGSHLSWIAKLRVNRLPEVTGEVSNALTSIRAYKSNLERFSSVLLGALFSISSERERHADQSLGLLDLLVRRRLAPLLHETYPVDFDFGVDSLLSTDADRPTIFARVFQRIETRIATMELAKRSEVYFTRQVVLMFLDEIDRVSNCQIAAAQNYEPLRQRMLQFDQDDSTKLSQAQNRVTEGAAGIFRTLRSSSPPSVNLERLLSAMTLMGSLKEYECKKAMARSGNPAIFSLMMFAKTWVTDKKMIALLFAPPEWMMVRKFVFTASNLCQALSS